MQRNPTMFLVGDAGPSLFGLTTAERLRRQFARQGVAVCLNVDAAANHDGPVIMARADAVLDQPLIAVLAETPKLLLMGEGPSNTVPLAANVRGRDVIAAAALLSGAKPEAAGLALDARTPGELGLKFWKALRKRETPYAFATSPANAAAVEWRMFMGTYKGATDIVTKHLWPVP
ncbi:MAG: hypothetical protein H7X89_05520, partial [Rhizobiales bacterium]|nr:hypothetical protein [Hyphomicrobiales bacterium]